MSVQISVRLADATVEALDRLVSEGYFGSRASVLEQALAREFRRIAAARDAAILAGSGPDPDLDRLASYVTHLPLDID